MKKRTRLLSLLLAISMMIGMLTIGASGADSTFADDTGTGTWSWASDAIYECYEAGIINGYTDGTYLPDSNLTRAEAAKIIALTYGLTTDAASSSFSDVSDSHWALSYIEACVEAGIINGYTDGTFLPEQNVTRAEMAKMIAAASGLSSDAETSSFSDVSSGWALSYIEACVEAGIITGYSDGTFLPGNSITRAEAAAIISRVLALGSEEAGLLSDADVIGNTYSYDEVNEAYGFTTTWTITFAEGGTGTMFEPNDFFGDTTYNITWTYSNGVFTVTLVDTTDGEEASTLSDMFDDDNTGEFYVYSDGTFEPVVLETLTDADVAGNTYSYDEVNEAYGFTTTWTITFAEGGTGTMFEPNDFFGDTTYNITWTYADGIFTVTLVDTTDGEEASTLSDMFDDDNTGEFYVYSDGTFAPVSGSDSDSSDDTEESESDADYANVLYASNSDAQVMDIYIPENATGSDAVIVVVHGGGFKFGSQTMEIIQPIIEAALENGYVVASVDYRKSGEATFPGALADVKAAVRYLKANAETYGIDPDQIVIWGESAGAYLSLMTALTPEVEALNGDVTDNLDYSSSVAALVDFYGPVEFYTMDDEYEALGISGTTYSESSSFESTYLGQAIGEDEEYTYTTWWYTYVDYLPDDFTLSAWIQAGTSDTSVPYTQSVNFASLLETVIGEENVSFSLIEGAEHEDDLFYTDENLAAVFEFLAGVL